MKVTLIDHMGDDISVVNSARVSFDKKSMPVPYGDGVGPKDKKLLGYLARHKHWTPFAHVFATFHIEAPIFVARQLVKHQVGLVWNEESRRYIKTPPDFYYPTDWRAAPENAKQGSSDEIIDEVEFDEYGHALKPNEMLHEISTRALQYYQSMLAGGVAPEQARMILPLNAYTQWYWSGSLAAFARVCTERCAPDAQKETGIIAWQISDAMQEIYPNSWKELRTW